MIYLKVGERVVNMNFEQLEIAKDRFIQTANAQERKGIQKYGQPLNPLDNYCWLDMAMEEQTDGFKYLVAEQEKRKFVVAKIRKLLEYKNNSVSKTEINH